MQVEEIALLNTTLMRPDGGRFLFPNIVMSTLGVVNIARSGPHNEAFSVSCMLRFVVPHQKQPVATPLMVFIKSACVLCVCGMPCIGVASMPIVLQIDHVSNIVDEETPVLSRWWWTATRRRPSSTRCGAGCVSMWKATPRSVLVAQ